MDHPSPGDYSLKTENEIKKIKLAAEHGLDMERSFSAPDLTPELEGQFLDYVQQWEEQYAQRKKTTVGKMLGDHVFTPVDKIVEQDIPSALTDAMNRLNKHGIKLDMLCPVNDTELYRFITEELLEVEINDIQIPGMTHGFIYEEFHPNHPYDTKNRCVEVIEFIFTTGYKEDISIPWGIPDHVKCNGMAYAKQEFGALMNKFRSMYTQITFNALNFISVVLGEHEDCAEVLVTVNWSGLPTSGVQQEFEDDIRFCLALKYDWWEITALDVPVDWMS